jgi:hypothetical protein
VAIWWTLSSFALPLLVVFLEREANPHNTNKPRKSGLSALLIGFLELGKKRAKLAWEAAVLPLNYARGIKDFRFG